MGFLNVILAHVCSVLTPNSQKYIMQIKYEKQTDPPNHCLTMHTDYNSLLLYIIGCIIRTVDIRDTATVHTT